MFLNLSGHWGIQGIHETCMNPCYIWSSDKCGYEFQLYNLSPCSYEHSPGLVTLFLFHQLYQLHFPFTGWHLNKLWLFLHRGVFFNRRREIGELQLLVDVPLISYFTRRTVPFWCLRSSSFGTNLKSSQWVSSWTWFSSQCPCLTWQGLPPLYPSVQLAYSPCCIFQLYWVTEQSNFFPSKTYLLL